jgi:uncharacterized protein (TIGR02147 family)
MRSDPKLIESTDYRQFLKTVFDYRKRRNPRYSARAFAKSLKLSHSHLSGIWAGTKRLTSGRAQKMLPQLSLSPPEEQLFLELVSGLPRSPTRERLKMPAAEPGEFSIFSHWYNMVILELAAIPNARFTAATAAKAIGIPKEDCLSAIRNLVSLGVLEVNADGSLLRKRGVSIRTKAKDETIDEYGDQLIDQVKKAVHKPPLSNRATASILFPMDSRKFRLMQEKIFSFLHELMLEGKESTSPEQYDSVYLICAQAVPVASFQGQALAQGPKPGGTG